MGRLARFEKSALPIGAIGVRSSNVHARLARTLSECKWLVYAATANGKGYLVGATGKRLKEHEVPDDIAFIAAIKLVGSGLKFRVYDTSDRRSRHSMVQG